MKLMQVIKGRALLWPDNFTSQAQIHRGPEGYVVDLDAPCEAEWCKGQLHKLEPAPEGSKPSPIDSPIAKRAIEAALKKDAPAKAAPVKKQTGGDLPAVDVPAKREPSKF